MRQGERTGLLEVPMVSSPGSVQEVRAMRSIPVEVAGLRFIATGAQPQPVQEYAEGKRTEVQEADEKGRPLIRVSLFIVSADGAEELRVKVPAANCPREMTPLVAVTVTGLIATPYVSGQRVAVSYRAESVAVAK